jgi:hypothetical protein
LAKQVVKLSIHVACLKDLGELALDSAYRQAHLTTEHRKKYFFCYQIAEIL